LIDCFELVGNRSREQFFSDCIDKFCGDYLHKYFRSDTTDKFSRLFSSHFSCSIAQYHNPSHGFGNVYAHECLDAGGYLYCRQQFSGFCWWYTGRCIPGFGKLSLAESL
jgi:hypothetical protein